MKAREAVEMRAQIEKKLAQKEKEKKEENLRQLAQKAREERAGIRRAEGRQKLTEYWWPGLIGGLKCNLRPVWQKQVFLPVSAALKFDMNF